MKQLGMALAIIIGLVMLPKISIGQQVNNGIHLAITPHADLYQKDSTNIAVPVKNQKGKIPNLNQSQQNSRAVEKKSKKPCSGILKKRKKI